MKFTQTKKKFHSIKRKKNSYKYKINGGNNYVDDASTTQNIMNKVKSERELDLGNMEIVKRTSNLLKGLFVTATERIAKLANVNISDSSDVNSKLDEIKEALGNPKNKEKLKQIVSELADNGIIAIQAASPFFKEFMEKAVDIGTKTAAEVGESIVKIGLNVSEEIPGVGILIGTIRSLSNAGEAFLSSTNAVSEIITASSDAINAASMNYTKIIEDKKKSMNRIQNSINHFTQPMTPLSQMTPISHPISQLSPMKNTTKKGGSRYKYNNRTKYNKSLKRNITII
jgi:hypothetical protein